MKRILAMLVLVFVLLFCVACAEVSLHPDPQPVDPNPVNPAPSIEVDPAYKNLAKNVVTYDEKGSREALDALYLQRLALFSTKMYALSQKEGENYVMSPLSMYMALSVLAYAGDDGVKADVYQLFGMDADDLAQTGKLFLSLLTSSDYNNTNTTKLDITNSIWLNTTDTFHQTALDELANQLYCHAFEAPFATDNAAANSALRNFVKEKTRGLIDQDFGLSRDTLAAIVNTLYFKDIWGETGYRTEQRDFYVDGTGAKHEFLIADYYRGEVAETEVCQYFYTKTYAGYKFKIILPKEGYTLAQAMSADNLALVNAAKPADFIVEHDDSAQHYTRCIFPSFETQSDTAISGILAQNGYLSHAFSAFSSPITDSELYVSNILQKAVVKVNHEGVEGAVVTIVTMNATSVAPIEQKIYHDFVVDRAFGYLITTANDVILFAGQINTL